LRAAASLRRPRPRRDGPLHFVGLAGGVSASQWKAVAATLRRLEPQLGRRLRLRVLAWGAALDHLRSALSDEPNIEQVALFARPHSLTQLGEVALLSPGGAGAFADLSREFQQAGMPTYPLSMLEDPANDSRLRTELRRLFVREPQLDPAATTVRATTDMGRHQR